MISKTTRLQRQARERKLRATGGSAGEIVFMWADEWLVIRSESDLQEALRRAGLFIHLPGEDGVCMVTSDEL
jgi:hypothetical protein